MKARPIPWMTRQEAAAYLRCSTDTVDRNLIPANEGPVAGKMRYGLTGIGSMRRVRIWTADVVALCPPPEGELLPGQHAEEAA